MLEGEAGSGGYIGRVVRKIRFVGGGGSVFDGWVCYRVSDTVVPRVRTRVENRVRKG